MLTSFESHLTEEFPNVRHTLHLYMGNLDTESILLQPAQRTLAATIEQVSLLVNSQYSTDVEQYDSLTSTVIKVQAAVGALL